MCRHVSEIQLITHTRDPVVFYLGVWVLYPCKLAVL
jgi:hypothetical protein